MSPPLPSGYALEEATPALVDYHRLRAISGLTPFSDEAASAGLPGTCVGTLVRHAGQVVGKSTAVINPAPGKADSVNAQATNTTAPNNTNADAAATGGRGKAGTKAESEVMHANARAVKEPPGSRMKTEASVKASKKKHAESKRKGAEKAAER